MSMFINIYIYTYIYVVNELGLFYGYVGMSDEASMRRRESERDIFA